MSQRRESSPQNPFAGVDGVWPRLVLEDAGIALWTWDLASGVVHFHGDSSGTLGYIAESLPRDAAAWSALIHPDEVGLINERLRQANRGEVETFDVDCRVRSAAGEWVWIRMCGRVAERAADGRIALIAGFNIDVSDRRYVEEALLQSERRYRTLVENQGEGIGIVDEQERFTFANPAADEIFGVQPGMLVGRSLRDLMPAAEYNRILEQTAVRQAGERSSYEMEFIRQDNGERRTLLVTATPQIQEDGTTYAGAFGVFRDITERKEAEEKKAQLEDRLRQTAKMEALGQLAGGVAHDLNNLLSPILGYTELLLQEMDGADPARGDLLEIEEAAKRARDLTQQLTAFGRKQMLRVRVVNLNDLVARSHEMFRRLISEDIAIELTLQPDLGNTQADEGQVQQILMNLIINARDAIGGAGTIFVETQNVAAGDGPQLERDDAPPARWIRLTIRDTGHGMDDATQKRIFEPFFSTKHKSKGTGLGLATVHGIVRQHDGRIVVDSSPGKGAAFHVYLPLTAEAVRPVRKRQETTDLAKHDETVLVVEDNDAVRRHVCRMMQRMGFAVLEARGGAEAVRHSEEHVGTIHVLVTDVIMPHVNGPEVYRALRELRPDIKVVYMSGYTDDALGERGIIDDEIVFLQKPFTRRSLLTAIEDALAK